MSNENELSEIEQAFQESWVWMERFFARYVIIQKRTDLEPIYRFIFFSNLAYSDEYTTKLRAGQAMDMLMLSRSKEHGLREDQPWLRIFSRQDGAFDLIYITVKSTYKSTVEMLIDDKIRIVDELKAMLDDLVKQPID